MIDPDTLKQAVELAPGWMLSADERECLVAGIAWVPLTTENRLDAMPQAAKDALAAELTRLVDAIFISGEIAGVLVIREGRTYIHGRSHIEIDGPDRTANTINAVCQFAKENPGVLTND